MVKDRSNSVYIPPDRELNESNVPRALPLDDELRLQPIEYLLVRPDNGKPWMFLSPTRHDRMINSKVNEVWKDYFRPEYIFEDDDQYDSITSHFGRHRFTAYFRNERVWQEEVIDYVLGHEGSYDGDTPDSQSLSTYVHTYYEDVRDKYIQDIYKFGLGI